jgi:hypothetical protein
MSWMFAAVRQIVVGKRLAASGVRTTGHVISSGVEHRGGNSNHGGNSRRVETIQFGGPQGTVRAVPTYSDVGMLDRSGMDVTVFCDRERPERFVAPRNGRSMAVGAPVFTIVFGLLFGGFAAVFLGVAGTLATWIPGFEIFPGFGG